MADPSAAELAATVRVGAKHGKWSEFGEPALRALLARCEEAERERDRSQERITEYAQEVVDRLEAAERRVAEMKDAATDNAFAARMYGDNPDLHEEAVRAYRWAEQEFGNVARAALEGGEG